MARKVDGYEIPEYKKGQSVVNAENTVNAAQSAYQTAQKNAAAGTSFSDSLKDSMNKILNRKPFEYDIAGDALYNQFKNQYTDLGQHAMKDTTAQAANLTGGYGNSYGVTAGNQAYQGYLNQLNNKIPELYQIAQDRYNNETQQLMNNYSLLSDADATEYGRQRDQVGDAMNWLNYAAGRADTAYNQDYGKFSDWVDRALTNHWNAENLKSSNYYADKDIEYREDRAAVEDAQWQKNYDLEYNKLASKYSDSSNYDSYTDSTGSGSSGSSGSNNTGDDEGLTTAWDWTNYFSQLCRSDGVAAAQKELAELIEKGSIPKDMIAHAKAGLSNPEAVGNNGKKVNWRSPYSGR